MDKLTILEDSKGCIIEDFFTEGGGKGNNCMRISFGGVAPGKIRIGVEKLSNLICSKLK